MKFVQHTGKHSGSVKCFIPSESASDFPGGKPKMDMIVFKPESIDHITNSVRETGFVRLTDGQYDLLLKNKLFTHSVEGGFLVVLDELPYHAQTPADLIAALNQQLADKQAEVDELKASAGKKVGAAELKAAQDQVKALTDEVAALKAGNDDGKTLAYLNAIIDAIDPEVVAEAKSVVENKAAASSGPDF